VTTNATTLATVMTAPPPGIASFFARIALQLTDGSVFAAKLAGEEPSSGLIAFESLTLAFMIGTN
jgi:hypothetical protein